MKEKIKPFRNNYSAIEYLEKHAYDENFAELYCTSDAIMNLAIDTIYDMNSENKTLKSELKEKESEINKLKQLIEDLKSEQCTH